MVQVTKTQNYLTGQYIRDNKLDHLIIIDEPIFKETKYGEKLECKVGINGEEMLWTLNNTNKDTLIDAYGENTADWVKKKITIEVIKVRVGSETKDSINVVP